MPPCRRGVLIGVDVFRTALPFRYNY